MKNADRLHLPTTLHLIDRFGTTVLAQVKDDTGSAPSFGFYATLIADGGESTARQDSETLESIPTAARDPEVSGTIPREADEVLAALRELSKTAPRIADLDRLMTRHPMPQAYHDEPGWEDDAE